MNDNLKIYTNEVIQEEPLPQSMAGAYDSTPITQSSANQTFSNQKIQEQAIPAPKFANEVIGQAINTKSRKIIQQFEFTKYGALQVGEYKNGSSGDIRISPNGIVARNISGENTVAIDGDTGDALFKGTVRASTLESNNVLTGLIDVGTTTNNSYVRLDGANNRIIVHDGTVPRIVIGNI